jgi:hypothetical protein
MNLAQLQALKDDIAGNANTIPAGQDWIRQMCLDRPIR